MKKAVPSERGIPVAPHHVTERVGARVCAVLLPRDCETWSKSYSHSPCNFTILQYIRQNSNDVALMFALNT